MDSAERCWSGRTGLTANSQGYPNKGLTGFHQFCYLLTELDTYQWVAGRIVATSVNNGTDMVVTKSGTFFVSGFGGIFYTN
jgi:hypothetical protein